jgi:chemotaxis-related protein WspD
VNTNQLQVVESIGVVDACWNRIGVAGDRSCPELVRHHHCRNCPVYSDAARSFFDRPPPEGYRDEAARRYAATIEAEDSEKESVLVFQLGNERLALPLAAIDEVSEPRPVHRIPRRMSNVLRGLTNLRGQLLLFISLHGLIHVVETDAERGGVGIDESRGGTIVDDRTRARATAKERFVVLRRRDDRWVFRADHVVGIDYISRLDYLAVPSTSADVKSSFCRSVFLREGATIGRLDEDRILDALAEIRHE